MKTRAVRDGDHYRRGQKTWNTLGQYADWIFCLVRTDAHAKQQSGITFLLIDMKSPGITVRPIMLLDGGRKSNEIWFENVRVPVENPHRRGEPRLDLRQSFLLGHERTNIAGIGTCQTRTRAAQAHRGERAPAGTAADRGDPLFATADRAVEIDLWALEITNLRVLSAERHSPAAAGPEASILKVRGRRFTKSISELMMRAVGPYALPMRREAL